MSSVGGFFAAALAGCLTGAILAALAAGLWVVIWVDYEGPDVAMVMVPAYGAVGGFIGFMSGAIAWAVTSLLGKP
jgi:hypothetical protein